MRRRLIGQGIAASCLAGIMLFFPSLSESLAELDPLQVPPAEGVLLVAHPLMDDPNFRRTVVLLIEHGPQGTVGFILNRPSDIPLSQALPDLPAIKETGHPLFIGGPVSPTRMTMLVRLTEPLPDVRRVFDGIYVGGSLELLERLVTQPKPTEAFRVFAGTAGWAPGQLTFELRQGVWATLPPDASIIFDHDPDTLWAESLRRLQTPRIVSR